MPQVQEDEPDQQQREGQGQGLADAQRAHPEDRREEGKGHEKPANVRVRALGDFVAVAQKDDGQGDPERPIAGEGAVTEIVAGLHLLESGHELGEPSVDHRQGPDGADAAPPHVMKLKHQGRDSKTGKADYGWISKLGLSHGLPFMGMRFALLSMSWSSLNSNPKIETHHAPWCWPGDDGYSNALGFDVVSSLPTKDSRFNSPL